MPSSCVTFWTDIAAAAKPICDRLPPKPTLDGVKCGADGVRCDVNGNVWASSNAGRHVGHGGVTVWTPEGKLIGRIRLPEVCGNICFGGPKRNRLFMAASQSLYGRVYRHARRGTGLTRSPIARYSEAGVGVTRRRLFVRSPDKIPNELVRSRAVFDRDREYVAANAKRLSY
jgi:hypothetical protein